MGTPAKADGYVGIKGNLETTLKVRNQILSWVKNANENKLVGDFHGDYDITLDLAPSETGTISFNAYSQRSNNLEWQVEKFREYCESIPEVSNFEADIWIRGDSQYFERE